MPTPTTLGPTDVSLHGIQESVQNTFQRKAFFAERRHWVFYVDDGGMLLVDSSPIDSELWEGPQPIGPVTIGGEFSVFVQESPSASYVHLVYSDMIGGSPIFYIRGTLASDGTIDWDAPDEAAPWDIGWQYEKLGITMGYDGNIYIVYNKVLLADVNVTTPYVCQSTTADGTWTTGLGYPLQITAVEDASWVPLVSPYWEEVMVVYAAANGSIYSRVLSGGVWGAQVDTGVDIGGDPMAISIVSETRIMGLNGSRGPVGTRVHVAYQAGNWDLYSITYDGVGWGAVSNVIQVIGAFRAANPMLAILDQGDSDGDHMPGTLYCFWTPTADAPTAEWVTYRLSRDRGDTWTDEIGEDAAEEWIDERADGFEIQASGSAYSFSDPDYYGKFYIGLVYMVHRMPAAVRHAGLVFEDPSVDGKLLGEVIVRNVAAVELGAGFDGQAWVDLKAGFNVVHALNLPGEFIVRHTATPLNLFGEFFVTNAASVELKGQFIVRRDGDVELKGEFFVNQAALDLFAQFDVGQGSVNLKGEFIVQHEQDENLKGQFIIRHDGDVELKGEVIVRNIGDEELLGEFIVQHPGSVDLKAGFRIDKDFLSKGLNVSVYRDLGVVG